MKFPAPKYKNIQHAKLTLCLYNKDRTVYPSVLSDKFFNKTQYTKFGKNTV